MLRRVRCFAASGVQWQAGGRTRILQAGTRALQVKLFMTGSDNLQQPYPASVLASGAARQFALPTAPRRSLLLTVSEQPPEPPSALNLRMSM